MDLLDLTLPPKCVACQKLLSTSDALICQHCYSQLGLIHHGCLRCGAPLPAVVPETDGCLRCHGRKWSFQRAVALGPYSGLLQQLVIGMKQPYHETTTMYFGKLLAERVRACGVSEEIDLVIPVPSHWLRRLTRKISTAEVLAESIALTLQLPWSKKYVWRSRATRKQGTLRASERGENVKAAFRAKLPKRWEGASILLVDDVLTSGATASEAAKSLLDAGAGEVVVASVARALGEHKMNPSAGEMNR
jgi:ComF family protein